MRRSTCFLDSILWDGSADLRSLFVSRRLFVNDRVAEFYGFSTGGVSNARRGSFLKIESSLKRQAGILSHPYVLARFAYPDTSSPIHRGVFLVRSVLGRPIRPPPDAFAPLAPDLHPNLTTRERVALQTSPDACQSCHRSINALGFTLEHFDAVGRFRSTENGKPIDVKGSYEGPSGDTVELSGLDDLARFVASSDETHRAFVIQLFHHLVRQPVYAYGPDTPDVLRDRFAADSFNVRKLIVRIATTTALAAPDGTRASPPPARERRVRRF